MTKTDSNDPLVTIAEAASRMGVKERRARSILAKNLICPVRTTWGIGYRLDDILAVKKMHQ
jgi:hypothetical protein